jgi:hypothetical protein
MNDLSEVAKPKSDQLNADDLIAGPMIIKIRKVVVNKDQPQQKVSIYFDGDDNKPYKPCLSMIRVLLSAWGRDGDLYVGRRLKLFQDKSVKWAGEAIGGIRISEMSDIAEPLRIALTLSKGKKTLTTIKPIADAGEVKNQITEEMYNTFLQKMEEASDVKALSAIAKEIKLLNLDEYGAKILRDLYAANIERINAK